MLIDLFFSLQSPNYIAGSGDGIVTVRGKPATRYIYLLDAATLTLLDKVFSLPNGGYVFLNLDIGREYMVMVRDYKRELEPFVWDYIKPADDLDLVKLRAII